MHQDNGFKFVLVLVFLLLLSLLGISVYLSLEFLKTIEQDEPRAGGQQDTAVQDVQNAKGESSQKQEPNAEESGILHIPVGKTYSGEVPMDKFFVHDALMAYQQIPGALTDPFEQLKKVPIEKLHPGDVLKAKFDYSLYIYSHNHQTIDPEIYLKGVGFNIQGRQLDITHLILTATSIPEAKYLKYPPPNAMGIGFIDYLDSRIRTKGGCRMDPDNPPLCMMYHQVLDAWMNELNETIENRRKSRKNNTPLCQGYLNYIEDVWDKIEISDDYVNWINKTFESHIEAELSAYLERAKKYGKKLKGKRLVTVKENFGPYPKLKELIHVWIRSHIQLQPCSTKTKDRLEDILDGSITVEDIVYIQDESEIIHKGQAKFNLYKRVKDVVNPLDVPVVLKVKP